MLIKTLFKNRLTSDSSHSIQMQGFTNGDLTFQPIQFSGTYVTLPFFFFQGSNLDWSVYPLALRTGWSAASPAVDPLSALINAQSPTSRLVSVWRIMDPDRRSQWPHAMAPPASYSTSVRPPDLLANIFSWLVEFPFARTILVVIQFSHLFSL